MFRALVLSASLLAATAFPATAQHHRPASGGNAGFHGNGGMQPRSFGGNRFQGGFERHEFHPRGFGAGAVIGLGAFGLGAALAPSYSYDYPAQTYTYAPAPTCGWVWNQFIYQWVWVPCY